MTVSYTRTVHDKVLVKDKGQAIEIVNKTLDTFKVTPSGFNLLCMQDEGDEGTHITLYGYKREGQVA